MKNKDFYVIELQKKIKVGITKDFKNRFNSIKTSAGIKDNEIINIFHYPDLSPLEARIKKLFSKQNINGEWFYKKEIVLDFVNNLRKGNIPTLNLLKEIQNNSVQYSDIFKIEECSYENYEILKENAINLLTQIKSERSGIGYPDSVELAKFMRTRRAGYRNMIYHTNDSFTYFERKPNFTIEEIKNSQTIECLRIIRNTTPNNKAKEILQNYIDSVFAKSNIYQPIITELIQNFFFNGLDKPNIEVIKDSEILYSNIDMEFDTESNTYSLAHHFEKLNKDELLFLKNVKNHNLEISIFGYINFDYKDRFCYCFFDVENYLRILHFFSISRLEDNGIRLFFNNTDRYTKNYIFQYKFHLLNPDEKSFIRSQFIKDISHWYIEFEKNDQIYYCLFDDAETVIQDLNLKIDPNRNIPIKINVEPI